MRLLVVLVVLAGCALALEKEKNTEAKSFLAVEESVKSVAKAAVQGKESKVYSNGEKAINRIRQRWDELQKRPAACAAKATTAMRDDCMAQFRRDRDRTRKQLEIVERMEKCVSNHKTDAAARKACVKAAAIEFLKLRPIRAVIKEDQLMIASKTKAVVSATKRGDRKQAKKDVEKAVAALYKRLADINDLKKKCRELESEPHYKECMVPVEKLIKENEAERKLVVKLNECRKIKDSKKRVDCVERAEDDLLSIVAPGTASEVPPSVADLDQEVIRTVNDIIARVEAERKKLAECESERCRRVIRRKIEALQREMRGVKGRFNPRRKCLQQRAEARDKEFRARAREHAELTELHDAAADCADTKCTAESEVAQARLEKAIVERRKKFTAEWQKLRCPFVAPVHSAPATNKATAGKRAGGATADVPAKPQNLKSLASMRQRLVELYAKLDECETGACKASTRKDIKDLTELIELLTGVEQRSLAKKRKDHSNRAALHRELTKYYLLAADCKERKCRDEYRQRLRALTKALAKMDRDELGRVKQSVKNQNKYYGMLRTALAKCPKSALGHGCRQMVVHAFRAGTELRQKALIEYLAQTARTNAEEKVRQCSANKAKADKCIADARAELAKRLAQLKIREMRIEKRRALRLCELTKDPRKCQADVEKEYARDQTIATKEADKKASATVKEADKKANAADADAKALLQVQGKPTVRSAAAALAVSVVVAVVCVLAL